MPKDTKLHEILAVESTVNNKSQKILDGVVRTFSHKQQHFIGQYRRYEPKFEDGQNRPSEDKHVATTVQKELNFIQSSLNQAIDVAYQKEATNAVAKADLIVDGDILIPDVPVTFLLNLETRLLNIKRVADMIPTLDNGTKWTLDPNMKLSKTQEIKKLSTAKEKEFKIVVQPTEYHPAEIREVTNDVVVGTWTETKLSGQISSLSKSQILGRIDKLIIATKKARAKANQEIVNTIKVGDKITKYIFTT